MNIHWFVISPCHFRNANFYPKSDRIFHLKNFTSGFQCSLFDIIWQPLITRKLVNHLRLLKTVTTHNETSLRDWLILLLESKYPFVPITTLHNACDVYFMCLLSGWRLMPLSQIVFLLHVGLSALRVRQTCKYFLYSSKITYHIFNTFCLHYYFHISFKALPYII